MRPSLGSCGPGKPNDVQLKIIRNAEHICFVDDFAEFVPAMRSLSTTYLGVFH